MSQPSIKEDEIFAAAIEFVDAESRSVFLDRACGDDESLRASIDELLGLHDTAGDFLATPPMGPLVNSDEEDQGATIGRYRLVERIVGTATSRRRNSRVIWTGS